MTKLTEWLTVFFILFTMWFNLYVYQKDVPYVKDKPILLALGPLFLVALFGIYAAGVVLYRVITFNNCEDAAKELQKEIADARADLTRLGFKFKEKVSR